MKKVEDLFLAYSMMLIFLFNVIPINSHADEYSIKLQSSYDLIKQKNYDSAQSVLDEVLLKDPGNALALNNLAYIMITKKDCGKANDYLEKSLERSKGFKIHNMRIQIVSRCQKAFGLISVCQPVMTDSESAEFEPVVKENLKELQNMMRGF
jgi:hypothetical protein